MCKFWSNIQVLLYYYLSVFMKCLSKIQFILREKEIPEPRIIFFRNWLFYFSCTDAISRTVSFCVSVARSLLRSDMGKQLFSRIKTGENCRRVGSNEKRGNFPLTIYPEGLQQAGEKIYERWCGIKNFQTLFSRRIFVSLSAQSKGRVSSFSIFLGLIFFSFFEKRPIFRVFR